MYQKSLNMEDYFSLKLELLIMQVPKSGRISHMITKVTSGHLGV